MDSYIDLLMVNVIREEMFPGDDRSEPLRCLKSKVKEYLCLHRLDSPAWSAVIDNPLGQWAEYHRGYLADERSESISDSVQKMMVSADVYTKDIVNRIEELCLLFGIELSSWELEHEYRKYLTLWFFDSPIKQLKSAVTIAFNFYWSFPLEELHSRTTIGLSLFPRKLKVFLKRIRSHPDNLKNLESINTIFQGFKKGLVPLRPHEVEAQLVDHRSALGTPKEEPLGCIMERFEELLCEMPFSYENVKPRDISRKATREYSYAAGGNVAHCLKSYSRTDVDLPRPFQFIGYAIKGIEVMPMYSAWQHFSELIDECDKYTADGAHAVPACILEPMKVRIITKPSAGVYPLFTGIQKNLWRQLKSHPSGVFSLIGSPLENEDLAQILEEWDVGSIFVSGDYRAATDSLKMVITKKINDRLSNRLNFENPKVSQLIARTLYTTKIHHGESVVPQSEREVDMSYSYSRLEEPAEILQENGQLMGHNLSFPILCIANYLAWHISMELYLGKPLKWFQVPDHTLKVNGDDILFKSNRTHYDIWQAVVAEFGFNLSAGKNFATDRFLQINSQLFVPRTRLNENGKSTVGLVQRIPYVNFGLITNRRKQDCSQDYSCKKMRAFFEGDQSDKDEVVEHLLSMTKIHEELFSGLSEKLLERTETLWNKHQRVYHELIGDRMTTVNRAYLDFAIKRSVVRFETNQEIDLTCQLFYDYPEGKMVRKKFDLDKTVSNIRKYRRRVWDLSPNESKTQWVR